MHTILYEYGDYWRVYRRLTKGDRHKVLMYGTEHATFEDFHDMLKDAKAIEVNYNDEPATLGWFGPEIGNTAFIHFCVYEGMEKYTTASTIEIIDWCFDVGERSTLFGLTPKPYRHVFKAITTPAGFDTILEEPEMCYMARYDKHVPGILTRLTKPNWVEAREKLREKLK